MMLLSVTMAIACFSPPTLPEAPPPRLKGEGVVMVLTGDTVLTLGKAGYKYSRVETADGPRIRVVIGDATIDTKLLRLKGGEGVPPDAIIEIRPDPDSPFVLEEVKRVRSAKP